MRSAQLIFVGSEWSCWLLFDPMYRRSDTRGFERACCDKERGEEKGEKEQELMFVR